MPPKKTSKPTKQEIKKKEKIVEDKTFGLKNKNKSKQVQKYIESVKTKVFQPNKTNAEKSKEDRQKLIEREEKARQEEMNKLLRAAVIQPKISTGADPKSIICEYYKRGLCTKGDKCKFSHDLSVARKASKISVYADKRDDDKSADLMELWDQKKLESVVEEKHGKNNKGLPPTTIVCKYFLDAVEKSQYGWFWQCPNGENCHYRHALPPGFVLKKKGDEEKKNEDEGPSLEEILEEQRKKLVGGTPVILETFMEWKKRKIIEREEKEKKVKEELRAKAEDSKGRVGVGLTGRDLFSFNPDMFQDDENAGGVDYANREEEEEQEQELQDDDQDKEDEEDEDEDQQEQSDERDEQMKEEKGIEKEKEKEEEKENDEDKNDEEEGNIKKVLDEIEIDEGQHQSSSTSQQSSSSSSNSAGPIDASLFADVDVDIEDEDEEEQNEQKIESNEKKKDNNEDINQKIDIQDENQEKQEKNENFNNQEGENTRVEVDNKDEEVKQVEGD